jgi:hypothetical protein
MRLKQQTINQLRRVIKFGEIIKRLFFATKSSSDIKPSLQNALIFCLKAIGTGIDNAAKLEQLELDNPLNETQQLLQDTLIFWKNLHYLRNALIHHFDCNMLNLFGLQADECECLFKVCKNMGQVVFYLHLVCDAYNTAINLRGQRFKVFVDVYEFASLLQAHNPRNIRQSITQAQYLQAMVDAIGIIKTHIIKSREISPQLIEEIRQTDEVNYYALQNLLEYIATLGNPNALGATQRISDYTRRIIFHIVSEADGWLRDLGQSRIKALHVDGTIVIPNIAMAGHIICLYKLHPVLFDSRIGVTLRDNFEQLSASTIPSGIPPINADGVQHSL